MSWWPKKLLGPRWLRGKRAETLACALLQGQGFDIQQTGARFPVGAIDIVAREGDTLCFVEIRSTHSQQWGEPLDTISDRKRRCFRKAAEWYLHYCGTPPEKTRFDVIAIDWEAGEKPKVELVRGAFTPKGNGS